nr:hypothetical protein [Micromonospora sp. DSM 115978]
MGNDKEVMTAGTAVQVKVGDGQLWRFGRIKRISGDTVVVDLGRDGTMTTNRDKIRKL